MNNFISGIGNYLERKRRINGLRFIWSSCDCGYGSSTSCSTGDCGYAKPVRRSSSCGTEPGCGYSCKPSRTYSSSCGYSTNSRC